MATTLTPLTTKQQDILTLLYTYRYLDTRQIQQFLRHASTSRVLAWLKDLRAKGYIKRHYDESNVAGRATPALYCLGSAGIHYLLSKGAYPRAELRNRYRDSQRTDAFIEACHQAAAVAIDLQAAQDDRYSWVTPADFVAWDSAFASLIRLRPSLCFIRHTFTPDGTRSTPYLLELGRSSASPLFIRQRLMAYIRYLDQDDWRDGFTVIPTVLFVCPDKQALSASKRLVRRYVARAGDLPALPIRFTTREALATNGVLAGIWQSSI